MAHLHLVAVLDHHPLPLWRKRLALQAAVACAGIAGRRERGGELRDAVYLLRPGGHPGPAGEFLHQGAPWQRGLSRLRPLAGPSLCPTLVANIFEAGGNPVAQAAFVFETVLAAAPRAETAALIVANTALARWDGNIPQRQR